MQSGQPTSRSRKIDVANSRFPYCIVWSPLPLITWLLPFVGHIGICDSEGIIYDFAGPYTINVDNFAFGVPTRYIQLDPTKMENLKLLQSQSQPPSSSRSIEEYNNYNHDDDGRPFAKVAVDGDRVEGDTGGEDFNNQHEKDVYARAWDEAVNKGSLEYSGKMWNLVIENCHSHVACCLNEMQYNKSKIAPLYWNTITLAVYMFFMGKHISFARTLYTYAGTIVLCIILFALFLFYTVFASKAT